MLPFPAATANATYWIDGTPPITPTGLRASLKSGRVTLSWSAASDTGGSGVARYEGDYFCLSYKEGSEWLLKRFAGKSCREPIRVAGYSVLQQTEHYLQKTEEGRRLFTAVAVADGRPHYVLATTRFQDHLRAPGKPVFTVERMGATLFYLFEAQPPDCAP